MAHAERKHTREPSSPQEKRGWFPWALLEKVPRRLRVISLLKPDVVYQSEFCRPNLETCFMATPEEISERVKSIIVEQLGVSLEEVTPQASFIEDLGADSLDIVELIMALEEEYDMEIPDEDAEKIQTVDDVTKYIQGKQS